MPVPTPTPGSLMQLPSKSDLQSAFVGQPLSTLRTPALIIDRSVFLSNCERVTKDAKSRGFAFRAHVKTHKTVEGTRMQVEAAGGVKSLIASTLPEVWGIIASGLVSDGLVDDILYSMPVSEDKIPDLHRAQQACGDRATVRLMLDHVGQVKALERVSASLGRTQPWSVFVKVDGGGKRAGNPPRSEQMRKVILAAEASPMINIFGFYSHFGQSYASKELSQAGDFFRGEIDCVSSAASYALELGAVPPPSNWILSVGATPTAHAATLGAALPSSSLPGVLELHAGCYCMCDLQQLSTTLIDPSHLALTVLASVVSLYPHRQEAMCDAGAIAVSKDQGPHPGYGLVVKGPQEAVETGWELGRVSQEHGTLIRGSGPRGSVKGGTPRAAIEAGVNGINGHSEEVEVDEIDGLRVGDRVQIVPQHACLVCAAYPWFYVIENGGEEVVDVWVPWKGW